MQGIIIAAGMGVLGVVCNWFYISQKAADFDKVGYIYIRAGVNQGKIIKEDNLGVIKIPKAYQGSIGKLGVLERDKQTVVGQMATRNYTEDTFLLRSDLDKKAVRSLKEKLLPNHELHTVAVGSRFIPDNFNPGDYVYFYPPLGTEKDYEKMDKLRAGPFKIQAIGTRQSTYKIGSRGRSSQENLLTVWLKRDANNVYDGKSRKFRILSSKYGTQGLDLVLVSDPTKGDGNN